MVAPGIILFIFFSIHILTLLDRPRLLVDCHSKPIRGYAAVEGLLALNSSISSVWIDPSKCLLNK